MTVEKPVFKEGDIVTLSNMANLQHFTEHTLAGGVELTERIIRTVLYEITWVEPDSDGDHDYGIKLHRASKRIMGAYGEFEWDATEDDLYIHSEPVTDDELAEVMRSLGVSP